MVSLEGLSQLHECQCQCLSVSVSVCLYLSVSVCSVCSVYFPPFAVFLSPSAVLAVVQMTAVRPKDNASVM